MDITGSSDTGGRTVVDSLISAGKSIYSLVLLLILWELVTQLGLVYPYFLPALSDVLSVLYDQLVSGNLLYQAYLTLRRAFAGLLIAIVVGVPVGVLSARSRITGWFFNPIIAVGYPVPIIALIPVFVLWFGIGDVSKILLVALGSFWPIAVNARDSTQTVKENLLRSARMMGTSERGLLWKVVMPASAPGILTGIEIALPISLIITFIFEMVAGGGGLGYLEIQGVRNFEAPQVYAAIFTIMVIGLLLNRALRSIRQRLLVWT
ncbi:ABC transporter permease [Halococcus hamelinensis]|uniref:Binding-protein-dependent transporters inner membrane component n=1 Tax=Halococcus hamelinensis 100A6 TaxID=1132509 RepID=M0LVS5_9EURY|nr:ABC transporter permease [Halococcus hamelinensis]EMA37263.1 binding-protein-dependent transporters inner membrane component [Halococcus hamelinensis 100A6]